MCRLIPVLGSLIVLAAALACGGSLEPDTLIGTWYLQTYNDSTVPGIAIFRTSSDSSALAIDSVRLRLGDGSACDWLVKLTDEPANATSTCIWTLDANPDDLLVTIEGGFDLRGDAAAAALRLRDPNGNWLVFGREPAVPEPIEPNPRRR